MSEIPTLSEQSNSPTLDEFESRLLNTEGPLTMALDSLYGEGDWTEQQADDLADAIMAAIDQAREDSRSCPRR